MNPSNKDPRVSVVMAVHNSAPYLREALASIRWQTMGDWECVCVDDGSTDSTPSILADFAAGDPRFRVLRQAKAGITAALTRGDAAARSNLIARMDSDDVALPKRLARQFEYLQANPECVGVGAQVMQIDPIGEPIGVAPHALLHEQIESRLLAAAGGTIAHPTLMFRRDAAEAVGGHRSQYEWAHDADLLVRLARHGRLANLPDVLLHYRQHPRNTCRTHYKEIRRQMIGLLSEAYQERGETIPVDLVFSLNKPARQTPLAGKWARRAARNGYVRNAWRLWGEAARQTSDPVYKARVVAELSFRSVVAVATGKKRGRPELPDWRSWDCPAVDADKLAA